MGHSPKNCKDPLRFWQNLVCLKCLRCLSLLPFFSSIHHIVSDLWPQIFKIFHKTWFTKSTIIHHSVIISKQNFQWLKSVDWPLKWSLNYGKFRLLKTLIINISKSAISNSLNFLWIIIGLVSSGQNTFFLLCLGREKGSDKPSIKILSQTGEY